MNAPEREFSRFSLAKQIDMFRVESEYFERDVHILILGTLDAAKSHLRDKLGKDTAKLSAEIETASGDYAEYLSDQLGENNGFFVDQERFLLSMAVVALASRLTHALRQMAQTAETFSPRKKKYKGKNNNSEFDRIWAEFKERFGFDLSDEHQLAGFIEPLREVRNQIVHDGGLANPYKFIDDVQEASGDSDAAKNAFNIDDLLDKRFSRRYPEFVSGEGSTAEVAVSQEQLESILDSSVQLVKWCAARLRDCELASAKIDDEANPGRIIL